MLPDDENQSVSEDRIVAPLPRKRKAQYSDAHLTGAEHSSRRRLDREKEQQDGSNNEAIHEGDNSFLEAEDEASSPLTSTESQIPLNQMHFPFNNFNIHAAQVFGRKAESPDLYGASSSGRPQLLRTISANTRTTAVEFSHASLRHKPSTRSVLSRTDSYNLSADADDSARAALLPPPIYDPERESNLDISRPSSRQSCSSFISYSQPKQIQIGRPSTLLLPSTIIQKPWLSRKDIYVKLSWWISIAMMLLGVGAAAVVVYLGAKSIPNVGNLCLVMQDDFDTFDTNHTWMHEVDMSGFGNGEFQMTTQSPNNSYVSDGVLYIVPTLTSSVIGNASVYDGYTYNVTGCTNSQNASACGAVSNATTGAIINPVMSARLSTKKSYSIGFGKVEVRAKLPTGDWLWPAIWMLPVDNVYGPWPQSGEIDIMESRGNGPEYPDQGRNFVRSTLNWGPTTWMNTGYKTYGWWEMRRKTFADDFHVYGVEWTPDFIYMYVDSRIHRTLDLRFKKESFFQRGQFPQTIFNYTSGQEESLQNPWAGRDNAAPFDQPFYLILNVAVGGTNGWFPDKIGDKPWLDGSFTAMRDFAVSQDQWYPTWPSEPNDRGMAVDYVKMWKQC